MSSPGGDSYLDDSVLEFTGRLIIARPVHGWGWAEGNDERTNTVPVDEPTSSFGFQVAEFFVWNHERRGGIGHIQHSGHIYDGHWLLFYTRVCGCFDFVHRIADYNFHIGRNRPSLYPPSHNPRMAEAWPLPRFGDCPSVWGYGQIAASQQLIDAYEQERKKKWEHERST